ncbi:MAG TPA: hypothetical protein VL988_14425 [Solirubrobacteraceae bacterium]|nr:hypothetical protein [Solirubrobacteraceae bacterium]
MALLALALAPAVAQAGSLLSGYGGPGEGNQAVLGSAVIGGSHGGSGGSGSSGSSGSASGGGSETSSGSSSGASSGSGEDRGAGGARQGGGKSGSAGGGAAKGSNGAAHGGVSSGAGGASGSGTQQFASFYPAASAEKVPSGGQGVVLGLTGGDILLIVLAAVVLIAIGLLTRRLDRPTGQAGLGS